MSQHQSQIYQNNFTIIDENAPEIEQPSRVSTQLLVHQRKAVYKLSEIEQSHKIINCDIEVNTNVGIYADKVGSGKSLTIATLLGVTAPPANRMNIVLGSNNEYISVSKVRNTQRCASSNLLIVPHNLINQWMKTLLSVNGLDFKIVNKNSILLSLKWGDLPDVVLISNTMFRNMEIPNNHIWNRVIIDEPQSLTFGRRIPDAEFIWFVCATPIDVIYSHKRYIGGLFTNKHWTNAIVVKNKDEFVEASLNLPNIEEIYILCSKPFRPTPLQEALKRLRADDIRGAAKVLNVNVTSGDNICDSLVGKYKDLIHNKKLNPHDLSNIEHIKNRIFSTDKTCPICLDAVSDPRAITECCHNSFCFECILMAMSVDPQKKCPMCKLIRCDTKLHIEANLKPENEVEKFKILNNKEDTLINILNNLEQSERYLICTDHEFSLQPKLHSNGILYAILRGSAETQQKIIKKYRCGEIQVLLITQFTAGINLDMSTHVCIHDVMTGREDQIIGRANRFGRTTPLKVVHLTYKQKK